ncbi:MAG: MFS transporter [Cyclobacteriaceae bacterium]|jgi:multidrug resistance protein|nr:MFS transporter [Cyclobacteriaceae bacterium]
MRKSPLFVLFITIFIDLLGFGIVIPILPIFSKELGAADYQVGLIAAIFPVMNFLFAPFWGTLSDRHGRRPIILISVCITCIAYMVFGLSTSLVVLFLSRLLSGIGSANFSVAQAYIADVTPPQERAKAMGLMGAAFGLGFIFGPVLGGYLKSISPAGHVDLVGYVSAAFCVLNLVLAYFLLPESLKELKKEAPFNFRVITGIRHELRKDSIRELMIIQFIFILAFMLMQLSCSLLWDEVHGLSEKHIGYTFAFIGLTTAIIQGTLVGGMVRWLGERKLLVYGAWLMVVGLLILPFVDRAWFVPVELLGLAIVALANGCLTPSISSLLSKYAQPNEVGQTLGISQSFGSLARAVGMGLSGLLYGVDFHLPFVVGAGLMVLTLWFIRHLQQEPTAAVVA